MKNLTKLIKREVSLFLASLAFPFYNIKKIFYVVLALGFFAYLPFKAGFNFLFSNPLSDIYWYHWLLILIGFSGGLIISFFGVFSGYSILVKDNKNKNHLLRDAGDNVGPLLVILMTFLSFYSKRDFGDLSSVAGIYAFALLIACIIFPVVGGNITFVGRFFLMAAPLFQAWKLFEYREFVIEASTYAVAQEYGMAAAMARVDGLKFFSVAFPSFLLAVFAVSLYLNFKYMKRDISGRWEDEVRARNDAYFASEREKNPVAQDRENVPLEVRGSKAKKPKLTFKDLHGNNELKQTLLDAASQWKNKGKYDGKNGIFMYGPPGTGKTIFAEALAGELSLNIIHSNAGNLTSRWVGQSTEQMLALFDTAIKQAPCVLFIDEIDSLLIDRDKVVNSDSEKITLVNTFLTEVEKLHDARVLVIGATNFKDRCDATAIREGRFDFKIEVGFPDYEARLGLIGLELQKAGKTAHKDVLSRLSKRWADFNVKRIMEAAERGCCIAKTKEVGMKDFMAGLRSVQGNKTGINENALSLSDLYFDRDVHEKLSELAVMFARTDEIEAHGGQVPKGVIFYGPPGTGKTTMAQALAKEAHMTFISTNGKKLLSDEKELERICKKASDLRPAIIFIDEADDILGDRNFASPGMKFHTNELLERISGANGPLPDVVWMAATNNADAFDDGVTRRFPKKIELPVPGIDAITRMIADWAKKQSNLADETHVWVAQAAQALEGSSPSMIRSILDSARSKAAIKSVATGYIHGITISMVLEAKKEMHF